jgi:hypothetical protein
MIRIKILSAAALALAALSAHAQSPDAAAPTPFRVGVLLGTVEEHGDSEPLAQVTLGVDFDRTWSVEALAAFGVGSWEPFGQEEGRRQFDSAYGARVLATLPLAERWSLVGGLGVVSAKEAVGHGVFVHDKLESKASPMVSLSANYHLGRRWSLGVEVSSFTQAHTFNAGLRSDFHF